MASVTKTPEERNSFDDFLARYPWAKGACERVAAQEAKERNRPRTVGGGSGWKRDYHPANASQIAGVGSDVKNTRGVAIAGKKKATGGK